MESLFGGVGGGCVGVVVLHVVCAALYRFVPCKETTGYVCDDVHGTPLKYRLSGLRVYAIVLALFVAGAALGWYPLTVFADDYWGAVAAANVIGLAGSALALVIGRSVAPKKRLAHRRRAITIDQVKHKDSTPVSSSKPAQQAQEQQAQEQHAQEQHAQKQGQEQEEKNSNALVQLMSEFYAGLQFNPRVAGIDLKMYAYLYGAVLLQLVLVSALASHYDACGGEVHLSIAVYVALFTWFIAEYIFFENVHLYTYDLFAERFGFKLLWGCFVFYPLFYGIGVWPLVDACDADLSAVEAAATVALFYCGWGLTRGANLQKYYFKVTPTRPFLGIKPQTISDSRILYSGFWGIARHINYLGEIMQGVALALPGYLVTGSMLPWLYPLYYLLLLIPRQWEVSLRVSEGVRARARVCECARACVCECERACVSE